ncbi:hypothetical protein BC826DRAFT_916433 [Russula brevipes]|nr:hypothetical protein BC826DRAFT_916433 [Russula brevipes]
MSWQGEYMGNAADVLLKTISSYLAQVRQYGPHASILNSSGTGKSRMVDELSRTIITVPICLREGPTGFPPPDVNLRRWFNRLGLYSRKDVVDRLLCMICSLLNLTLKNLQDIEEEEDETVLERQRLLAKTFRELMTDGQKFSEVNAYRRSFFDEVIALVEEATKAETNRPLSLDILGNDIQKASQALQTFLDHRKVLHQNYKAWKPFVIFSFDEAHELTKSIKNENWTIYIELRRCLFHHLVYAPFFFLFISTAGNFHDFSPETQWEPSTRIVFDSHLGFPPITETGFDQLAFTAIEGQTTLEEVMTDRWITHLGRPSFGSRYDASGDRFATILDFATSKLLAGHDAIDSYRRDLPSAPLDKAIASFSMRFPLEFDFSHPDTRAIVAKQIEHHMRLCIVAESRFELPFSTVGSEPLLAEAASYVMATPETNPVKLLSSYMDNNCISVGERGELVALCSSCRRATYWQCRPVNDRWGSSSLWKSLLSVQDCGQFCHKLRVQTKMGCNSKMRSSIPEFG